MGARKGLLIAAGIITLVSTFLFFWIHGSGYYLNGYSILNIVYFFTFIASSLSLYEMIISIIALILFICLVIAGIMQLVGIKVKGLALAFGIIPVVFVAIIFLSDFIFICDDIIYVMYYVAADVPIIPGIIPLIIPILEILPFFDFGTYLLLTGGILAIVGGAMSRDSI